MDTHAAASEVVIVSQVSMLRLSLPQSQHRKLSNLITIPYPIIRD